MNLSTCLAPIEKLALVARSAAFTLFALAPAVFFVLTIDLVDVLASKKTGMHLFVALAGQWIVAIAVSGMLVSIGLRLSKAARALYERP